jgi:allantoate deiminase
MSLRRDAFAAAAEMALMVERRARAEADLVAIVGRMDLWPGAANVIRGHAQFSIDLRAPLDARRQAALAGLRAGIDAIPGDRALRATVAITHEADAFAFDPRIVAGLRRAVESLGVPVRLLPSGAGHDTMAIGRFRPAGMLFVRCKGGVGHNPLESITEEDCAFGLAALSRFVQAFRVEPTGSESGENLGGG